MAKSPTKPAAKPAPAPTPVPAPAPVVTEPVVEPKPPVTEPVTPEADGEHAVVEAVVQEPAIVEPVADEPALEDAAPVDLGPDVTVTMLVSMSGAVSYVKGDPYVCSAAEAIRLHEAAIANPATDADVAAIDAYLAGLPSA